MLPCFTREVGKGYLGFFFSRKIVRFFDQTGGLGLRDVASCYENPESKSLVLSLQSPPASDMFHVSLKPHVSVSLLRKKS